MDIAAHIRKQSDAAGSIDKYAALTGIPRATLFKWRRGDFLPRIDQLPRIGLKVVIARPRKGAL